MRLFERVATRDVYKRARRILPLRARRRLLTLWQLQYRLPGRRVRNFDRLRRLTPISRTFGLDRGQPIDRYYIENFLAYHAGDIRGRVMEIGDDRYTRKYGGGHVEISDVLDIAEDNRRATIAADLTYAHHVPSNTFDCVICTQTLHYIYDLRSAIQTLQRILRPGGVLLATTPGISQIGLGPASDNWYWGFTTGSARRLFEESFAPSDIGVEPYGNVLAAISLLHGLAAEELNPEELNHRDFYYQVLITVRAIKRGATSE